MAGLVPAIPILNRDRRDKPGDDSKKKPSRSQLRSYVSLVELLGDLPCVKVRTEPDTDWLVDC